MLASLLVLSVLIITLVYLLGFRLGADKRSGRLLELQRHSRQAEREIQALTRSAFVVMAERAMRDGDGGRR